MKLATIGSGMIVNLFLDALSQVKGIECDAIYSRTQEKAQALADKFQVKKTYTSLEKMFADPEIDVIYIASPNSLHYEQAKAALLANKHVICEKPLTSTLKELDELLALAKAQDKIFVEAITNIHMPNYAALKENLPLIGQVKIMNASFLQYSSRMDLYKKKQVTNVFDPEFSGGALMDINVYNIHFICGLFGKPSKATYHPQVGFNGIDLAGTAILEYPDMTAICVGGKNVQGDSHAMIYGEQGSIKVNGAVSLMKEVIIQKEDSQIINEQTFENHMVYEIQNFVKIIENHDIALADQLNEHSRMVYEVLHGMRKKAGILFPADR